MVFFVCDGCGETLKKAQVDTHASRCNQCHSVSCVDCSTSYFGDEYRSHTACISEAERYEKSTYRGSKKGKAQKNCVMDENGLGKEGVKYTPQEAWMNVIRSSIDNAPAGILASLTLLGTLDNVPRKEKQFRNFTSNSLRLRHNNALVGKLWDHLLQTRAEGNLKQRSLKLTAKGEVDSNDLQNSNDIVIAQPSLPTSETTSPHVDETKVIKKNSAEEADQSTRTNKNRFLSSHDIDNSKLVKKAISKMLRKAPGHRMKIKQLRKQIRAVLMVQKDKRKELKRLVKDALGSNSRVKNIRVEGREVLLLI